MAVLKDVALAYVKIQQPAQKFETEGPQNTEWTVDCVISEAAAGRWTKQFAKQPAKAFSNAEFKKIYKFDAPFADQDKQFVVKLKKDTHFNNFETKQIVQCDPKYRAKLYENIGERDGKPLLADITKTKLVSNGSSGVVMYDIVTNKYGTFAKLKAVRVDNLTEYQSGSSVDEIGEVVEDADYSTESDEDYSTTGNSEPEGEDEPPFDPDEESDY